MTNSNPKENGEREEKFTDEQYEFWKTEIFRSLAEFEKCYGDGCKHPVQIAADKFLGDLWELQPKPLRETIPDSQKEHMAWYGKSLMRGTRITNGMDYTGAVEQLVHYMRGIGFPMTEEEIRFHFPNPFLGSSTQEDGK